MRPTAGWAPLCLSMCIASAAALGGASARAAAPDAAPGAASGVMGTRDDTWSSLWLTPEQRAQRLLDSGHPDEAAGLFKDPRRRAYADLKAGRYAEAAKLLKPFRDERSQYNLGNALAWQGDLTSALAAYNAALDQAPGDHDARHNRDLVAQELEREAKQGSGKGGSQQQGASGQQQGGNDQSRGSQSKGSQSKSSSGQGQSGSAAQTPGSAQSGSSPQDRSGTGSQEADQAQRDAELAARLQRNSAQGPAQKNGQSSVGGTGNARSGEVSGEDLATRNKAQAGEDLPPPKSEQTLALEQWLRRIPDDPGGLLRRKFLIEHIERQQAEQSQGEDTDQ